MNDQFNPVICATSCVTSADAIKHSISALNEQEEFQKAWPEIHSHGLDHGWRGVAESAWNARALLSTQPQEAKAAVVSFNEAWKTTGYQYGEEALENVRLGWSMREKYAAAPQEPVKGAVIERLECVLDITKEALAVICADTEATYNAAKAGKPLEVSIGQWRRLQRAKTRIGAPQESVQSICTHCDSRYPYHDLDCVVAREPAQADAQAVHFFRKFGEQVWIECAEGGDPREVLRGAFEYRTLYTRPADSEEFERVAAYQPGHWFEAHSIEEMQSFYLSRLPAIREVARLHGYAIGLHGSNRRDFDLMAMQWADQCSTPDELAHAIARAACGITHDDDAPYAWEKKPQGRIATSMCICWADHSERFPKDTLGLGHLDLSIMGPADSSEVKAHFYTRISEWRNAFDAMHQRAMKAERRCEELEIDNASSRQSGYLEGLEAAAELMKDADLIHTQEPGRLLERAASAIRTLKSKVNLSQPSMAGVIVLTPAEIQSSHDRVRWAEGLIRQLPENHDGRNSWLLNFGSKKGRTQ